MNAALFDADGVPRVLVSNSAQGIILTADRYGLTAYVIADSIPGTRIDLVPPMADLELVTLGANGEDPG